MLAFSEQVKSVKQCILCAVLSLLLMSANAQELKFKRTHLDVRANTSCTYQHWWQELQTGKRGVKDSINKAIIRTVSYYVPDSGMVAAMCAEELDYQFDFQIKYQCKQYVSIYCDAFEYYKGSPHGNRRFSVLNFDVKDGAQVLFSDLWTDPQDGLLLLQKNYAANYPQIPAEEFGEQMASPDFILEERGITVLLHGNTYWTSVIEILLSREDLKKTSLKIDF